MKTTLFTVLLFLLASGFLSGKSNQVHKGKYWSVRFAEAVMARNDSLIHYNGNKPKYEYDLAFLGTAIARLGTVDLKYFNYMKNYIDYFVDENGKISGFKLTDYNIDRVRPGFDMIELFEKTGKKKYRIAFETLVGQMETQPRTKSNGFWHKKVYPWQMWLDGIYMAEPFLVRYARKFNVPKWFDEAVFQIKLAYEKTYVPRTGLLCHAWDESRTERWCDPVTGQSAHTWSRATGWYMMAVVDVLDYLPEKHPGRIELIDIFKRLSSSLLKYRDSKTGLWYQVVEQGNREGNYIEASGSAMIIYAFAKGSKKGYLDKQYFRVAGKSFDSLTSVLVKTGEDGLPVLTNTCGACGLGGTPYREADYNYYITEKRIDNDPKGVAPVILAALELGK